MVAENPTEVLLLPIEVWVKIFSYLTGPDLFRCEAVCVSWRKEIRYQVKAGKITRRGLKCERLITEPQGITEHRRNVWDTISVKANMPVVIVGVGIYSPSGVTTICVDARPIEDPLRPIDVSTELDSCYEEDGTITTLFGKADSKKPFRFYLEPNKWWEIMLNIRQQKGSYDPMGGGTIWCGRGCGGKEEVSCHGVTFSFRTTDRDGWRSELEEGQFPFFYFWKL